MTGVSVVRDQSVTWVSCCEGSVSDLVLCIEGSVSEWDLLLLGISQCQGTLK